MHLSPLTGIETKFLTTNTRPTTAMHLSPLTGIETNKSEFQKAKAS